MHFPRSTALVVLAAALMGACSSTSGSDSAGSFPDAPLASLKAQLDVELRSAPMQPPSRGANELELRVRDGAGAPRDGLTISVTPFMAAHGHGAPGAPVVTAEGGGRYVVSSLQLPMSGTWELRLVLRGEGGFEDHATATIEVQ